MDPDFSGLKFELERLCVHGYETSREGQEIVKIAESGVANIPIYSKEYTPTRENLSGTAGIEKRLEAFRRSGDLAVCALQSANQNLGAAKENILRLQHLRPVGSYYEQYSHAEPRGLCGQSRLDRKERGTC
jgi:hypothetical protein